jgi:glycerol-3-phosphate dehydrogenase
VISTFAGVRPLAASERKDPWAISRRHLIHEDPNGLISVVGGKFTTFRKMAEEVVDRLAQRFPDRKLTACRTAEAVL